MCEEVQATQEGRFRLRRESDYAIIDSENKIAPIMVAMESASDGSESNYTDRASVLHLLNKLDYESKHLQLDLSVGQGLLGLEENMIMLEKIMHDIDYIGRRNFKETNDFSRQREERYLIGIQKHYERLFDESWKLIRQIRNGLE